MADLLVDWYYQEIHYLLKIKKVLRQLLQKKLNKQMQKHLKWLLQIQQEQHLEIIILNFGNG